ncbi:hypothetical protein A6V25_08680 [Nostoc sp. ATCC 53789]|nr:hypothetical protein A6V25_08680 [Nostoc sp. ATCC 53789]
MNQPCFLRGVRGDRNTVRQLYKTCVYTVAFIKGASAVFSQGETLKAMGFPPPQDARSAVVERLAWARGDRILCSFIKNWY